MLNLYILDYLTKHKHERTASSFRIEAGITTDRVPIDATSGFLLEWWNVFWDVFSARYSQAATKEAYDYMQVSLIYF